MLGDESVSRGHQQRSVLLPETTVTVFGDKAEAGDEETVQRDAGGG